MDSSEGMEVKKGNHAPRYCKTCEHYKPPRGTFTAASPVGVQLIADSTSLSTVQDLYRESPRLDPGQTVVQGGKLTSGVAEGRWHVPPGCGIIG